LSISITDLALYALAVFILFLTPGPVWVALLARTLSGGFQAAWPLALGVSLGDAAWPLLAILGVSWLVNEIDGLMRIMRIVGALMFLIMGTLLITRADRALGSNSRLTRPGMWAGFVAGVLAILSNPKAILFYMGVLPGFFDLTQISNTDIFTIVLVSVLVPFLINLTLIAFVHQIGQALRAPSAVKRINIISGCLLVVVGLIILFT
jgi:threonine/homoserine/homoserine lactone efflux protein